MKLVSVWGSFTLLNSMTGYGRGVATGQAYRVTIELRAVNHRFRDLLLRLPKELLSLDEPVRRQLSEQIERGRIELMMTIEAVDHERTTSLNLERARAHLRALNDLRKDLQLSDPITLNHLLSFPDIWRADDVLLEPTDAWQDVSPAFDEALSALLQMRRQEGQALATDMLAQLELLAPHLTVIKQQATTAVERYEHRLRERLQTLRDEMEWDEQRVATEIVLFADRCDINEELVRLQSHLEQLKATITAEDGRARGRKLEFVLQEINREINTIGSKAQASAIAKAVIEIKSILEKLREQAQNVE